MKVLCDTNIFIHYFANTLDTVNELEQNIGLPNVVMPSIAAMELFRGMNNKNQLANMKAKIKKYNIFHIDRDISRKAVEFLEAYRLSHDLKLPDALIGAMAVVYQYPLFTYNVKDFRYMPGIILHQIN
ncbi:MAG: type II toxin-antitoxin system VapC family toxin [Bacteroidota bacterium]